ncbi:response regulator transcription factor [Alicyclobacillus sp. SO9]|uniref:response regulator transcription factor n=1 Tax=Alicyclobacillus sp. SO9 TaxID=2665646 RepID=UPI0018E8D1A7|nr:response regulator transcription factor [Alicyclobacillus sp. SO9]QQE81155.1 response regulator transcription factor [Alicyclobacillus sp. SO9]
MSEATILLVDDEQSIVDMLKVVLAKEGFTSVHVAHSGNRALELCDLTHPDIVVLDVMLPDMEGFLVAQKLREITDSPILFLTARSSDLDKLMGFGMGGDDYITKPFNPLEVVARLKAHLRRRLSPDSPGERTFIPTDHTSAATKDDKVLDLGRFQIHEHAARLVVNGRDVDCPAKEFQLLVFLCKHPNYVFSRNEFYEVVWGADSLGDDSTVMVHIRRLREKIEANPGNPSYIVTVRGLGYKLVYPPQKAKVTLESGDHL